MLTNNLHKKQIFQ